MKQQQHSPVHDGFQPAAPHATPHTHISHTFGREPLTKGFGRVAGGAREGQKEKGRPASRLAVARSSREERHKRRRAESSCWRFYASVCPHI